MNNNHSYRVSILVIESHPDQRDLLAIVLQREGYRVLTAENGIDALKLLKKENIHIVLSDIMMTGMDGFQVIQQIRSDQKLKNVYFIFLTSRGQEGDRVRGLDLGANDYITKPYSFSELLARIRVGVRIVRDVPRPLNEARLIIVGHGRVGKTSILRRLIVDAFSEEENKTEGINIVPWTITVNGKEHVQLNMWDFGGQEIMHATHQFFLSERSLYLLVLNSCGGGEDADAEYWLKLIESFGKTSPVLIVLNKIEEQPFDLNQRALKRRYPAIQKFIKTDCKTRLGLDQLRQTIEQETAKLEFLRIPVPATWFGIKNELSGMKRSFITYQEYREICTNMGEADLAAQDDLATYLHTLGIVLNYKNDPRLQDTHVLKPQWVTNGIYKILNSSRLESQEGSVCLVDLSEILDKQIYPPHMYRFLFDLMGKFDLCFSYPDEDSRYLVPELLAKQELVDPNEFKPHQCLNFYYHYSILPKGLLPRFIVRSHVLSEGLPRWRTGVVLKFEGNHALIREDVQDKKISISVTGPGSGRRRLLGVIRSDFEDIHADIPNLQVEEMVPLPERPTAAVRYQDLVVREQAGQREFSTVVENQIIALDIKTLLSGVDLDYKGKTESYGQTQLSPVRLFISYAHQDERWRNELDTHLKLLVRQGILETWHDRNIEAGDDWKREIDMNLEHADIILFLVSANFIASDYCYEKEMKRALERHDNNETRVVPIIVRDVNWKIAPFAKLQVLPKDGLPVTKWQDSDSAWRNVSEHIEKLAVEFQTHRNSS